MFNEEKCPECGFEDYDIDDYWDDFDDFDEEGGIRVWECTCPNCNRKFQITYTYNCTAVTVD